MKNPFVKILIVFVSGIIVSRFFWFLGFLPNAFKYIINPGNCSHHDVKTIGMYICSALVAFKMLLGPILFMVLIIVFRKSIFSFINKHKTKIPDEYHYLLNPLVATLIFTIVWSGIHYNTSHRVGILHQRSFPVIISLFTYITTEYYQFIQAKLVKFFEKRDKFSKVSRYIIAILIPVFLSFIITFQDRVSSVAVKEQFIVIVSLITGYLALIPKKGSINIKQLR